jgi:hypothetical protein
VPWPSLRARRSLWGSSLTPRIRPWRHVFASTREALLSFLIFYPMRTIASSPPAFAVLPRAPKNTSPVPWLTSLYHKQFRGNYGRSNYPGNCSGEFIKDLLLYFKPQRVADPMTGSGTCKDVCNELKIECYFNDIRDGFDACDPTANPQAYRFDFVWIHPPYWRQKIYTSDSRDLSRCPTLDAFLLRYEQLIRNCASMLVPGGKLAILMGDYSDRDAGFVPLVYHTKRLAFDAGLRQACTDIIRFQHGNTSSHRQYTSSFIPGLHDVCTVFEKVH